MNKRFSIVLAVFYCILQVFSAGCAAISPRTSGNIQCNNGNETKVHMIKLVDFNQASGDAQHIIPEENIPALAYNSGILRMPSNIIPPYGSYSYDPSHNSSWIAHYFQRVPLSSNTFYEMDLLYPKAQSRIYIYPLVPDGELTEEMRAQFRILYDDNFHALFESINENILSLEEYIRDQSYSNINSRFIFPLGEEAYSPLKEYILDNGYDARSVLDEIYASLQDDGYITEENVYWHENKQGINVRAVYPIMLPGAWEMPYWGLSGSSTFQKGSNSDYFKFSLIAGNLDTSSYTPDLKRLVMHEYMHILGLPDLYSIRLKDGYYSINGDIMAHGMKISGFHRFVLGWCPIIKIRHDVKSHLQNAFEFKENKREIYGAFPKGVNGPEFFVLELNYPMFKYYSIKGYFNSVPDNDRGLAIWHIDLAMLNTALPDHPHMALERALGDPQWWPEGELPPASDYDPDYFGYHSRPKKFAQETVPSSVLYTGAPSGVEVNIKYFSLNDDSIYSARNKFGDPVSAMVIDVGVGSPLLGDVNGDGIVNEGDAAMLRLNMGRRVGIDALAVPVDVNGDGFLKLVYDRDEDGFIATSERIYDTAWNLVHTSGDWLDINGDGKNDLDAAGTGQFDAIERWYEEFRRLNKEHPPKGGISTRNPPVPWHEMSPGLFEVSARSTGQGLALASKPIAAWIIDQNEDGIIDFFDAEGDGKATLVPARLDADGDGVITEMDAAYMGYYWGETTFEELWIPLPAPSWANY